MNFKDREIDFVKHRKKFFLISGLFTLIGIIVLLTFGLNLGIDFESGSRIEVQGESTLTSEEVQAEFEAIGFEPDDITLAGNNNELAYATFSRDLSEEEISTIQNHFNDAYGLMPNISTVSPTVGKELARNALISVLIALIGIIIYVTIRFELLYGVAAIVALFHDAFFIIAIFSLLQIEVNVPFIAAVLTIVGYSINDTIVTFDRIRENMKYAKRVKGFDDLADIVNKSLVQTLARSINMVLTVMFAAAAIFVFGGEAIRSFAFALLIGLVAGTYSSMFLASQLWLVWKSKQLKKKKFRAKPVQPEEEPTP
ncbi:protein translocase subunit SecF [Halalkalibacterium halodurans]|uniref:Protein-export membrane protein SecF n=1 Tax=Halalkalibacterium halodurans (strain ATCC BAA-125 / DSM 18197 / FERM 7344 / JCM 9153 / C-125) TaxID=272558 RepID=Q9KDH6_HALH5|nr:protein translocase subunit SecF [Halalkalibacterium halodurans]MED4079435.1 protein translocase subunit SecF [Halalkalibacterium halodurans]MED4086543.1 protein translocase subunit SecF [Halalkalibacterium halodurans]MED4104370.1 protein translocase subunit SecF [Halalkalibacterium halodurans]MED4108046.1 protein translocase subunit SecF [Halalkalibacterium halodurans]MED4122416.1 protein translocase subunit SecF [Halalkalibacterium halodurans]